jgi:hypothetical protein
MKTPLFGLLLLLLAMIVLPASAQIYAPEGLNMPGSWDTLNGGWRNPPSIPKFAGIVRPYGLFLRDTSLATWRYRTVVNVQSTGGDLVGGTYKWLFTSPFHWGQPDSTAWGNKWKVGAITINSLQNYSYFGVSGVAPDSNIVTLADGNWYTVNWRDNGYAGTSAIWMSTSAQPVAIPTVVQSPLPGSVNDFDTVTVTATLSGPRPPEQNFFVRYTTNNFIASNLEPMTVVGTTATAKIRPQSGGTTVKYYVFSTTAGFPSGDYDVRTLTHNNNNKLYYSYSVIASQYFISVSTGANGSITPPGPVVTVLPGANITFTISPNPTYFVDSVMVDNALTDSTTSYTFTNVSANHSIYAAFAQKVNVTYQVNMSRKMLQDQFRPDSNDFVAIRGGFNNWGDPPTGIRDTLRDPDNDSIYVITKLLKANTTYEHKFWKTVRGPGSYGYEDPMANRSTTVGGVDTTLPPVWFANDAPPVAVTFQVDMRIKMHERSFRPNLGDLVTVRGSFNDWGNSTNNPDTLHDPDNDSVWTGTFSVPSGVVMQFKFWKSTRDGYDYEELVNNRQFTVPLTPAVIGVVYFGNDSAVSVVVGNGAGWNMISKPVIAASDSVVRLFPGAALPYAFAFVPSVGYVQRALMDAGAGYWGKFSASGSSDIAGDYLFRDSIDVQAGWNMVGSISLPVDTGSIVTIPAGIALTPYYGYNGGYAGDSLLRPGKAYWVKTSLAGQIVLETSPLIASRRAGRNPLEGLNSITITDASGAAQTLYFGRGTLAGRSVDFFELPPVGPQGVFDARFGSRRMVEIVGPETAELPVDVQSTAGPLLVSWNIADGGTRAISLRTPAGETKKMSGTGMTRLASPAVGRLIIALDGEELPREFALSQNYPNPFNPATTINYALPADARVSIRVFDILGREVAALVNELQSAGVRTIEWNGRNAAGLQVATGVYFYRLDATSVSGGTAYTNLKKMLLVK